MVPSLLALRPARDRPAYRSDRQQRERLGLGQLPDRIKVGVEIGGIRETQRRQTKQQECCNDIFEAHASSRFAQAQSGAMVALCSAFPDRISSARGRTVSKNRASN